jgi:predicted ArsR family transcriptional regulator
MERIAHGTTRKAVLVYITEHPGCSLDEIAGAVGVTKTPVKYHVQTLISEGKLSFTPGRHRSLRAI